MIQYSKWISLSLPTRAKIAEQFNIPKIRSTSVINNVIADDGYDVNDMEKAMTVDNLQTFLNSDDANIDMLFQHLVDVMEDRRTINAHVEPEPIEVVELEGKGTIQGDKVVSEITKETVIKKPKK